MRLKCKQVSLCLPVLFILVFCSISACSSGSSTGFTDTGISNSSTGLTQGRATGVEVTEEQISELDAWQQELLCDEGWNQPYIQPIAGTEMPAPTSEMLMAYTAESRKQGQDVLPRYAGEKGASWIDQGGFDGVSSVMLGEYDGVWRTATPPYGCNNLDNGSGENAFEDVIRLGAPTLPQKVSYVMQGTSTPNWFNTTGGSGNDAQSAVYQLLCWYRTSDPADWKNNGHDFEELSYRADLAPGIGIGGDCSAATAYLVTGIFWKRYNSTFSALPALQPKQLYDILIAPSSDMSAAFTSSGSTSGRYQRFYFGDVGACFGGAWIVGLESSSSSCTMFNESVANAIATGDPWHFSPVYGVLLKRWQEMQLTGMAGPWEGTLGWPVAGPFAFNDGNPILSSKGSYYAWGLWFERGYIWWMDYDQTQYADVPDEAQVYYYSGENVYCDTGDSYRRLSPVVYYGGSAAWPAPAGEPRVTVVADAYRTSPVGAWTPCVINDRDEYEIPLANNGLATVTLNLHAQAFGGAPNADCSYDYYVWAFRDGTIFMGDEPAARQVQHTYGSVIRNMESVYTVRVQVMDSTGAVAYGDSRPIVIRSGIADTIGPAPGGGITVGVIRNDGGAYGTSYDALVSDLDALQYDYFEYSAGSVGIGNLDSDNITHVIWYRGGPANDTETTPDTRVWASAEIDTFIAILEAGYNTLLVSQNHGYNSTTYPGDGWLNNYGWDENQLAQSIPTGEERLLWALGMTEAAGVTVPGQASVLRSYPVLLPPDGAVAGKFAGDGLDADGLQAAERYSSQDGMSDIPVKLAFGEPEQLVGYGKCSALQEGVFAPGFMAGVNVATTYCGWDMAFLSGGTRYAPYRNVGSWPQPYDFSDHGSTSVWWIGYPWATTEVTMSALGEITGAGNRHLVLENILNWLGSSYAPARRTPYDGHPEIMQVQAGHWDDGRYAYQSVSYTWDGTAGTYPDQTMPNSYVTTDPGDNYVVTASRNNDWINGNDIDFGFPWYAYINDVNGDGVQTGAGNNVDDTVFFGGMLLENPGAAWSRDLTFKYYGEEGTPDTGVPSVVIDGFTPPVVVAGYYVSTTGDAGGEVRANYGNQPASFAFDNQNVLTAECVAHWPASVIYGGYTAPGGEFIAASDPRLLWSMYPGHNMTVPAGYAPFSGARVEDMPGGWDSYRWMFDVDPGVAHAVRAADARWNRPVFNLTNLYTEGRVVTFDYRGIPNWNPDLNRDGDDNSAGAGDVGDKFPIRVRLITESGDYALWSGTWPNHLPDPGIDPAAGGPVWEDPGKDWPDYLEGGAYLVDTGSAVYD